MYKEAPVNSHLNVFPRICMNYFFVFPSSKNQNPSKDSSHFTLKEAYFFFSGSREQTCGATLRLICVTCHQLLLHHPQVGTGIIIDKI